MHLRRVLVVVWFAFVGSIVPFTAQAKEPASEIRTFIVQLKETTSDVGAIAATISADYAGHDVRPWQALNMFSVVMSRRDAARLRFDARVKPVAEDASGKPATDHPPTYAPAAIHSGSLPVATPDDRMWHLDRIDKERLPLDGVYRYCTTGAGVYVYLLDFGVMRAHSEFGATNEEREAHVLNGYNADPIGHNGVP